MVNSLKFNKLGFLALCPAKKRKNNHRTKQLNGKKKFGSSLIQPKGSLHIPAPISPFIHARKIRIDCFRLALVQTLNKAFSHTNTYNILYFLESHKG